MTKLEKNLARFVELQRKLIIEMLAELDPLCSYDKNDVWIGMYTNIDGMAFHLEHLEDKLKFAKENNKFKDSTAKS